MSDITKDWALYLAGKSYNDRLKPSYYDTVDANLAFFEGDQWRNLKADNMPKPVFNIIKRVITFQVASLTSSKTKIHFEDLLNVPRQPDAETPTLAEIANAQVQNLLEKFKFDFKIKDALFDAAITGDGATHFYFDMSKRPFGAGNAVKGEICMELVDGVNVFFGNANNANVDAQPYIIISGRDMVQNLKEEAKRYKQADESINSDANYQHQAGDSSEIEVESDDYGKALYIIVYRKDKKTGTIKASKSVENAYIYKDIDTGLTHYPVAWMNWEKQKNQYHGRALCTGILPNQIFINRMFAMVMYHLMMTAFPKAVYNKDIIPSWNNEIGSAIGVSGMSLGENIKNVAGYLEPGNMSNQIIQTIELAMQYTKETLGISDAALGQIDPKNTSAIIAVQKSSAIPLENPKSNLYEWIEDIGKILFDMMGTYYGERPLTMDIDGEKQVINFDFSQFKDAFLDVRADVGESSYWSEIASMQTMDALLNNQHIDIINYLERVPTEYIPQKEELIADIREKMEMAEQQQMMQEQMMGPEELVMQLSPEEQQAFFNAPPEVQQQIISQIQQPQAPQ
ncbi:portal protein [Cytobacillus oceanisediminis]|uniref:portal protein n=1 Tax=Cytobacillus oceanisediminis TaxID=665099 RepID=UPI00373657D5